MRYIATLLFVLLAGFNAAYADVPSLTEEQRVFIEDYIEAAEDKDVELYWDLIHPESRKCATKSFKEFTQHNFLRTVDDLVNLDIDNIRIEEANMAELQKQVEFFYRDKAFLSVEPNYIFTSNISSEEPDSGVCSLSYSSYMFSVPVAFYNGKWYEVLPCGKDNLEPFLAKQLQAIEAKKKHTDDLYKSISQEQWDLIDPILTKDRDEIEAINKLKENAKISLSEAKTLVDIRCDKLASEKKAQ